MNDIFMLLGKEKYANPETLGGMIIQKRVADTDETWIAVTLGGKICIHQTYIRGRRWDQNGAGGLAMVMIAEAQHVLHPEWSERECQTDLEELRQQIPAITNLAPYFHHGNEGSAD